MAHPLGWTYRAILWCHIIFKIIGLAPISLHDRSLKNTRTISFGRSKSGIFYNAFLSILLIASSFITLPRLYNTPYANKSIIMAIIEMGQATLGNVIIITILLCYVFRWYILKKISNYLVQIGGRMQIFSREPINMYRAIWNLSAIYIVQTIMCVGLVVTEELAFFNGPLGWAMDILPSAFAINTLFQYFLVISLMNINFTRVNEALQGICRSSSTDLKSLNRCRRVFVNCSVIQSLRYLRNIYDDLCEVADEVSRFYSFPTLLVVIFIFYSLLFNAYYILQPLSGDDMDFELFSVINGALFIVYFIYPLSLLTAKVTEILNEIERTGVIVHSLLQNTIDRKTKAELKQFSLQLLHRQIKFTASDYCNLDNTLFQSVVSSVITYLVILIQFQMQNKSSYDCQCDCSVT
nr:putative gustatory receptor 28b isoform X1 [Megalopta genalis]XP_033333262.1 putative gustatory receptor 28b isoform X1 [Megalopta genalis]